MLGHTAREICIQLGFGEEWLDKRLSEGKKFKLCIFPLTSVYGSLATWDGLAMLLKSAYPEVWPRLEQHFETVRHMSYEEIKAEAKYCLVEANMAGRDERGESTNKHYMSL